MANDQQVNLIFQLKGDLEKALGKVNRAIEDTDRKADKAGKSLAQSFKGTIKPVTDLISVFRRVGFVVSATIGSIVLSIKSLGDDIDKLNVNASRLGISTEELSKKTYGFNVNTAEARAGVLTMNTALKGLASAFEAVKVKMAEVSGSMTIDALAREIYAKKLNELDANLVPKTRDGANQFYADLFAQSRKEAIKSLDDIARKERETTDEIITARAQMRTEIQKAELTDRTFRMKQVQQSRDEKIASGVSPDIANEWAKSQFISIEKEKTRELLKQESARAKASYDTVKSFIIEQRLAYDAYADVWGDDGEIMMVFRQAQEAQLQEFKNSQSEMFQVSKDVAMSMKTHLGDAFADITTGFKNIKQIAADFGQSIINILSQAFAKMLMVKALSSMGGGWGSALASFMHQGGEVRKAHSGYLASDEVPIVAQAGEGIISKRGMASLGSSGLANLNAGNGGGGGVTININPVIQAWDASDVYRNRKMITGIITESIRDNSEVRKIMKAYA